MSETVVTSPVVHFKSVFSFPCNYSDCNATRLTFYFTVVEYISGSISRNFPIIKSKMFYSAAIAAINLLFLKNTKQSVFFPSLFIAC